MFLILSSQNELEVKHKDEIKELKNQLDKTDNRKIEEQHKTISNLNEENKNVSDICIIFISLEFNNLLVIKYLVYFIYFLQIKTTLTKKSLVSK